MTNANQKTSFKFSKAQTISTTIVLLRPFKNMIITVYDGRIWCRTCKIVILYRNDTKFFYHKGIVIIYFFKFIFNSVIPDQNILFN